MVHLAVYIEKNGIQVKAGNLIGNTYEDVCFVYDEEYVSQNDATPISISLPLQTDAFSPKQTMTYFDGLLPEGFSRRAVAEWMHEDENDYISILYALGRECIGAIRIENETDKVHSKDYEKLTNDQVRELAAEGARKSTELLLQSHLSLTGASGKVGLYTIDEGKTWYLPKGMAPSTHILKQSHIRLNDIVINEQLALMTAASLGIETAESRIVDTGSKDDEGILFSTRRYDRVIDDKAVQIGKLPCPKRLHQEDFAQALGIPAQSKYEKKGDRYMNRMFELIRRKTKRPLYEQLKLWDMIVFNYLIGNTDAHIKNYSLLYDMDLKGISLAPAYDIVSTVIYRESTRMMSFAIGGEYSIDKLTREHFKLAAKEARIGEKIAMERFDELAESFPSALLSSAGQLEMQGFKKALELADSIQHQKIRSKH